MITVEKRETPVGVRYRATWREPGGQRRSVVRETQAGARLAAENLRRRSHG